MTLNCIIVDDDPIARRSIELHCKKIDFLNLIAKCENVEEAKEVLESKEIDLVFLDVEMPGKTGMDLLEDLHIVPQVIFTTSKEDYAYLAFKKYHAMDYLLKPVNYASFFEAVQQVLKHFTPTIFALPQDEDFFVRVDGKWVRIPLADILYIENLGDFVLIWLTSKKADVIKYVVYATLRSFEEKLAPYRQFYKVHRSYIINLKKIVEIQDTQLIISDAKIPVARSRKQGLLDLLNRMA